MDITSIINNIKEMLVERGDDISLFEEHELSVDKEEYEKCAVIKNIMDASQGI